MYLYIYTQRQCFIKKIELKYYIFLLIVITLYHSIGLLLYIIINYDRIKPQRLDYEK